MKTILNIAGQYGGWFACVLGAARGASWLGPLAVLSYLSIHLYLSANPRREGAFILMAGGIGALVDGLQRATGLIVYQSAMPPIDFLAPVWIIAMWMLFASAFNVSLAWLQGRYWIAGLLGAIFGPLSYVAGVRLGAADWGISQPQALAVLALVWGLAVPGLLWLNEQLLTWRIKTPALNQEAS